MKEIEHIQLTFLDRVDEALSDLAFLTDPMKIEAKINFIRVVATSSYRQAHIANSNPGEWHDPNCFVMTQEEGVL